MTAGVARAQPAVQPRRGAPLPTLDFELPPELEAAEPPEARGLLRDEVRLLVSHAADERLYHARFRDLPRFLLPGDLLLVNISGTLNAALPATRENGQALVLHLSTRLPAGLWIVEPRLPENGVTRPFFETRPGETLRLPAGAQATLLAPYSGQPAPRLWLATLELGEKLDRYCERYGTPIRYSYVKQSWPSASYQTVFATEPGSAEMPSAGRAFTAELVTRLITSGVIVAPLLLHTGVSSQENHEPPYEEYYRVPATTARQVNQARAAGGRVIAVGTTAVRAIESVTDESGTAHPGEGWTRLIVSPDRGVRAVNGLITGLHEPRASHLAMLEAISGRRHLALAYAEALHERYLWHEFGDMHLILP